jgi:hypothetical protein
MQYAQDTLFELGAGADPGFEGGGGVHKEIGHVAKDLGHRQV